MTAFNTGWYVVYTRFRHEKKVALYLSDLKMECFLPTNRILKIFSGKKKYIQMPLFPSYVFVKLENLQQYFDSISVPGVLYFLKKGNQLADIQESVLQQLRAIITHNFQNIEVLSYQFNEGDNLDIQVGPLKGFCCEVVQHKSKNKLLVRIELLNRNILVEFPSYYLSPCLT